MALTPQMIEQMNAVTGWNVPTTPGAPPSRADEILQIARQAQETKAKEKFDSTPHLGQGAAGEFAGNAVRSVAEPLMRTGGLIEEGLDQTLGRVGNAIAGNGFTPTHTGSDVIAAADESATQHHDTLAGKAGDVVGAIAPYLTPAVEGKAVTEGAGILPRLANFAAKSAPEVARDTAIGTAQTESPIEGAEIGIGGAALKGATKIAGKAIGKAIKGPTPEETLDYITPTQSEIPTEDYKNLVNQGRIQPRTTFSPPKYILSDNEKATALKYPDVLHKDPIQTAININNKLGELDNHVGTFLRSNNGIFNGAELKNALTNKLGELDDITIPEERLQKAKDLLVNNFVNSIKTNNMEGLWNARKEYDTAIDSAFKGSPTMQKEVKVALRNAVQDFIAERTPEGEYKGYMRDMSNLFRLRDIADVKAAKTKGLDAVADWAKKNPRTAKIVGFTVGALGLGALYGAGSGIAHAGAGE